MPSDLRHGPPMTAQPALALDDWPEGFRHLPGLLSPATQVALLREVLAAVGTAGWFQPTMPRSGQPMSVRMCNLGPLGWLTDRHGYRYQRRIPTPAAPGRRSREPARPLGHRHRLARPARGLSRQPLPRRGQDGPAPGSRRGRSGGPGALGLARRRRAVPARRHQPQGPDAGADPGAATSSCSAARRASASTGSTVSWPGPRTSCPAAAGST